MEIMKKEIRILYSDIDGTLLNNSHHVFPRTRSKILDLDEKGIPFILVSARTPDGVRVIQRELGNRRPVICYSGGLILDENQKALYSRQMELGLAAEIASALKKVCPEVCVNAYSGELWVTEDDKNPWVMREERITEEKSKAGEIREAFLEAGGVHKFLLMGNPDGIAGAEMFLKKNYPGLSILRSNEYYLEVMDGSVDKAAGVRYLCDYYKIPLSEAAAFGDGENDVGMLQAVGEGYAMGNAPERVKRQVKHVTLSNEEEGVWEVIKGL
jgi:HAD-superfamily hydrolase, subfamily IIB